MTLPTHFEGTSMEETYGNHPYPGLLGHPRVPWAHSVYWGTAPVQRGVLVIRQLLCQELPPPPPDVEAQLPASDDSLTNRERFAVHRANPSCAGCHDRIDPIGFGFEGYDQMGRFRTVEGDDLPIDASGALTFTRDGYTEFDGVAGLRQTLLSRPEQFVGTVTEKLLIYALGRTLELYDAPTVRAIKREAAHSDYRMSSIILGIVKSSPFQMRRSQS